MDKKIIAILIFSGVTFALITINPLFNIFSFSFLLDKDLAMTYGTLIGGIFGPILSLLSFYLVYNTFKEQKRYNDIQVLKKQEEDFLNELERDVSYLRQYVSSIKYRNSDSKDITEDYISGEDFFIIAKMQLDKLYEIVYGTSIFKEERDIIGATFEIFYYGVGLNTMDTLKIYLAKRTSVENAYKLISKIRGEKTGYNKKIVYYGGHQGKMGHYFRQLYHLIEIINDCKLSLDKSILTKKIRLKMSNYEQAILCYNSFTFAGSIWQENKFIENYELIKNIQPNFLPFNPKDYFNFLFEYEKK